MSDSGIVTEIFSSIQGEGPLVGYRQIFIRMHGCNASCTFCDTGSAEEPAFCRIETVPGSQHFRRVANPVSAQGVLDLVAEWSGGWPGIHHSVSLTGGEPLLHADFLSSLLPRLAESLPLFLETNGTLVSPLGRVLPYLRYVSMDIKLPSVSGCVDLWDTHCEFLRLAAEKEVHVKAVVGEETEEWEIEKAAALVASVDPAIPFLLQPLTEQRATAITAKRLLFLQEIAAGVLGNVRVIPQTHVFLQGMI